MTSRTPDKEAKRVESPHPRVLAHLGDAVWGLKVAEAAVGQLGTNPTAKALHQFTVERNCAQVQADWLEQLQRISLTELEQKLIRQGRNLPLTKGKQSNQAVHRQATAFEVLLGYWWLHDRQRFEQLALPLLSAAAT